MNKKKEDPYVILGVSRQATIGQVKARYYELAKQHHPDKLPNLSEEERNKHEEIFKEITNAYSIIVKRIQSGETGDDFDTDADDSWSSHTSPDDWRSIWNELDSLFKQPGAWDTMLNIVKNTVSDVTIQGIRHLKKRHITVPVTMEEVHAGKMKKVRLFLSHINDPVYTTIDTSEYPVMEIKYPDPTIEGLFINIVATMELQQHPQYVMDDVLESWDLFTTVHTRWIDFLEGKSVVIPYIDGTDIHIDLASFKKYDSPIVIKGKGLCGLGDMYVSVVLDTPPKEKVGVWATLEYEKRMTILDFLSNLYE